MLRTLPPSQSTSYAESHDTRMWTCARKLLQISAANEQDLSVAQQLTTLPMRLGGLGLRAAVRTAPAAYWSSWADAIEMLHERCPSIAAEIVVALESEEAPQAACLAEVHGIHRLLAREGFIDMPDWNSLREGRRPRLASDCEPGEWTHGWQYFASSTREHLFRRRELLSRSVPEPAHVRSHSGPGSASVLYGCPTCFDYVVRPAEFRTTILERLHLPLQMTEATCECGGVLDQKGKHRASCPRSGRLKRRALPTERAVARICREAGATVRANVFLHNLNMSVSPSDKRQIEVIAQGLACRSGK